MAILATRGDALINVPQISARSGYGAVRSLNTSVGTVPRRHIAAGLIGAMAHRASKLTDFSFLAAHGNASQIRFVAASSCARYRVAEWLSRANSVGNATAAVLRHARLASDVNQVASGLISTTQPPRRFTMAGNTEAGAT